MTLKVLVLGRTGMLGHMVFNVLSGDAALVVNGTHIADESDLFYFNVEMGLEKLEHICLVSGEYDYIINCIGLTADKIKPTVSTSLVRVINLNSLFPHQLAEFALKKKIRVIHMSTDGVFSHAAGCCREDAPHDCTDTYGKTKSLGEVLTGANVLNIRCSIVGPSPFEKGGLFESFRSQPEGAEVRGYTNHRWNGVTTLQFAQLCHWLIKESEFDNVIRESCVHHFCPNREVTKYELLTAFNQAMGERRKIVPYEHEEYPLNRVLATKYKSLQKSSGHTRDMQSVVKELIELN